MDCPDIRVFLAGRASRVNVEKPDTRVFRV